VGFKGSRAEFSDLFASTQSGVSSTATGNGVAVSEVAQQFSQGDLETTGNNLDGTTNFIPRMKRETLREGYKSLLGCLYAPGPYYRRVRTFLREYQRPKISSRVNWRSFMAFSYANLRLGVFGRERIHYWGLLLWTTFRRPTLFALAVTLSIYGHHFRKSSRGLGL